MFVYVHACVCVCVCVFLCKASIAPIYICILFVHMRVPARVTSVLFSLSATAYRLTAEVDDG